MLLTFGFLLPFDGDNLHQFVTIGLKSPTFSARIRIETFSHPSLLTPSTHSLPGGCLRLIKQ